jgi:hypothetical protein
MVDEVKGINIGRGSERMSPAVGRARYNIDGK